MFGALRFAMVMSGALLSANLAHAGPSTFPRSCSDIRIEQPGGTTVSLGASCRDKAGREQPADFTLNGYHNIDGRLVYDGKGQSTFQRSCDAIDVRVNQDRVLLTADCKARDQRVRKTSIEIQDIHNIDGRLTRTVGAGSSPAVAAKPFDSKPCAGVAGTYNRGASTITVSNSGQVRVTVGPNRPAGTGSCTGKTLMVNFPDDRPISGVFDGRAIQWNNRTSWTKD